jgi:hypothetical protein
MVGKWKPIADYVEPSWDKVGDSSPMLFWRARKGAAFGYIRDGELFDATWVYICDAGKATHFSEISARAPGVACPMIAWAGANRRTVPAMLDDRHPPIATTRPLSGRPRRPTAISVDISHD